MPVFLLPLPEMYKNIIICQSKVATLLLGILNTIFLRQNSLNVLSPSGVDSTKLKCNNLLTGNKCFYMNTNRLNWTAARDHCREFGKGYDIASIEDIYEHGMDTAKYIFLISIKEKKYKILSSVFSASLDVKVLLKYVYH